MSNIILQISFLHIHSTPVQNHGQTVIIKLPSQLVSFLSSLYKIRYIRYVIRYNRLAQTFITTLPLNNTTSLAGQSYTINIISTSTSLLSLNTKSFTSFNHYIRTGITDRPTSEATITTSEAR